MYKFTVIPGAFYFHTKRHYVYIGADNQKLVALCSGTVLLPPDHPEVNSRFYEFFRPALRSEILNVLERNPNFNCLQTTSVVEQIRARDKIKYLNSKKDLDLNLKKNIVHGSGRNKCKKVLTA